MSKNRGTEPEKGTGHDRHPDFRHHRHHRLAIASRVAGTALLVGDGWAMGGGKAGSLTLAIGAITAMLWISTAAARYRRSF